VGGKRQIGDFEDKGPPPPGRTWNLLTREKGKGQYLAPECVPRKRNLTEGYEKKKVGPKRQKKKKKRSCAPEFCRKTRAVIKNKKKRKRTCPPRGKRVTPQKGNRPHGKGGRKVVSKKKGEVFKRGRCEDTGGGKKRGIRLAFR